MMDEKKSDKGKKFLRSAIVVVCSAFAGSAAQIFVMIPNGLTSGGLPGIVRIITHFMPWNYSLVYYCFGMAWWHWCTSPWGGRMCRKSSPCPSPIRSSCTAWSRWISVCCPTRIRSCFRTGGCAVRRRHRYRLHRRVSSGGTDSIARVIKFRLMKHVPIGRIMLFLDGSIIVMSAFVFDRNVAFYALITVFITSKITESILLGISGVQVSVAVITNEPQLLVDFVMHEMHRGVTTYTSTGEYTKTERRSVQIICSPRESLQIKSFLAEHDEHAFCDG